MTDTQLAPGMRVREVGDTEVITSEHVRPARRGTLVELLGTAMARVQWDEGQDQTGAPDGKLREFVEIMWLEHDS